jgi:hypothetical protein
LFIYLVLGIDPKTLHMVNMPSTPKVHLHL